MTAAAPVVSMLGALASTAARALAGHTCQLHTHGEVWQSAAPTCTVIGRMIKFRVLAFGSPTWHRALVCKQTAMLSIGASFLEPERYYTGLEAARQRPLTLSGMPVSLAPPSLSALKPCMNGLGRPLVGRKLQCPLTVGQRCNINSDEEAKERAFRRILSAVLGAQTAMN